MPAPSIETISISALQHYIFCPRQCALIHVDGLWAENELTVHGSILHKKADTPGRRTTWSDDREGTGALDDPGSAPRSGIRLVRALPLWSERLGLRGRADTIEFPVTALGRPAGPPLPVETKRGQSKRIDADRVQLCAQAMCIEEQLDLAVPKGAIFYRATCRREIVMLDDALRRHTLATIVAVRELLQKNTVPCAEKAPKCKRCSLRNLCLPAGTGPTRRPDLYLHRSLRASIEDAE